MPAVIPSPLISTRPPANMPVFTATYRADEPAMTCTPYPPSASATSAATVTLPGGATIDGTVASIGTVATAGENGGAATMPVGITVADQSKLGGFDGAPVDVTLVSAQAKDVLSVPVGALVALAEGGYGVQVIAGSSSRYVAVKTGMFAGGRVEITGDGITAGTVVGVPK